MKSGLVFSLVILTCTFAAGQDKPPLFQNDEPLAVSFAISIKQVRKETNDSTYIPVRFAYKGSSGNWDSLESEMRVRGMFRKNNCFFPPLRVRFKKADLKSTVFHENKSLKLVVPCKTANEFNNLIIKEFICYKFFETISPYTFNTRLADVTLTEDTREKPKVYQLRGFFIEDDSRIAKRFDGKIVEDAAVHPTVMSDTNSVRHDLFQYMIGNTDWSTVRQHNATLLKLKNNTIIPMAYDFDMSGVVNAPYATVDPSLGITGPTERIYRGYCKKDNVMNFVRSEFLKAEPEMKNIMKRYAIYLTKADVSSVEAFINEFYVALKSDKLFSDKVLKACRK